MVCALYCALFWIQGKTRRTATRRSPRLYCALFWIQGKTKALETHRIFDCTVPYFGFKAKQRMGVNPSQAIVLCLILDSRQNKKDCHPKKPAIVLCLILDSRQNESVRNTPNFRLYCALFWIQGKTKDGRQSIPGNCTVPYFGFKAKLLVRRGRRFLHCTVPYFGFKAKRNKNGSLSRPDCTVPYFGFKAKHAASALLGGCNCTVPYFGFKAKPGQVGHIGGGDCTVPYFGFKAKQMRLRSDGAGDCSAFGRAIPDGFLSVFL